MMIKHRKRAVSILLSAVMILTMWIPVSAAGENDLAMTAELSTASVTTADAGQTVSKRQINGVVSSKDII